LLRLAATQSTVFRPALEKDAILQWYSHHGGGEKIASLKRRASGAKETEAPPPPPSFPPPLLACVVARALCPHSGAVVHDSPRGGCVRSAAAASFAPALRARSPLSVLSAVEGARVRVGQARCGA
jgi:hypothetical protein